MTKADFELLTIKDQREFGNGCGPAWLDIDIFPDICLWYACREHDFYYRTYGNPLRYLIIHNLRFLFSMIAGSFRCKIYLIPIALLLTVFYWTLTMISTPIYVYHAWQKTRFRARSHEDMCRIYRLKLPI